MARKKKAPSSSITPVEATEIFRRLSAAPPPSPQRQPSPTGPGSPEAFRRSTGKSTQKLGPLIPAAIGAVGSVAASQGGGSGLMELLNPGPAISEFAGDSLAANILNPAGFVGMKGRKDKKQAAKDQEKFLQQEQLLGLVEDIAGFMARMRLQKQQFGINSGILSSQRDFLEANPLRHSPAPPIPSHTGF